MDEQKKKEHKKTEFAKLPSLAYSSVSILESLVNKEIVPDLVRENDLIKANSGAGLAVKQVNPQDKRQRTTQQAKAAATSSGSRPSNAPTRKVLPLKKGWATSPPNSSGRYMGATSFYFGQSSSRVTALETPPTVIRNSDGSPPYLSEEEEDTLFELYHRYIHIYFPLITKDIMHAELKKCRAGESSFLSTLFFNAIFGAAARYSEQLSHKADALLDYVYVHRDDYCHQPSLSTVLALIIAAHDLTQRMTQQNWSRASIMAGAAFQFVYDLGLHRKNCSDAEYNSDDMFVQLRLRTFWVAFIVDHIIGMTYGHPFTFEENNFDVPVPHLISTEPAECQVWIDNFNSMVDMSKVIGRIVRFNYSPQAYNTGPSLFQDAMLSTLDSWIMSIVKGITPVEETDEMSRVQAMFNKMKRLWLCTLLILLHRPHADNTALNEKNKPAAHSLHICLHAALIITDEMHRMSPADQERLARLPTVVYSCMIAIRVHLMNATCLADEKLTAHSEISFTRMMLVLRRLVERNARTLVAESLQGLNKRFEEREHTVLSDYVQTYDHQQGSSNSSVASPTTPTTPPQSEITRKRTGGGGQGDIIFRPYQPRRIVRPRTENRNNNEPSHESESRARSNPPLDMGAMAHPLAQPPLTTQPPYPSPSITTPTFQGEPFPTAGPMAGPFAPVYFDFNTMFSDMPTDPQLNDMCNWNQLFFDPNLISPHTPIFSHDFSALPTPGPLPNPTTVYNDLQFNFCGMSDSFANQS